MTGIDKNGGFAPIGFKREHWKNADTIRKVFKQAFFDAGLPYFNPHSLRSTIVQFGQRIWKTPEETNAWSQNLGHDDTLVTLTSYGGQVSPQRQAEMILGSGASEEETKGQSAIAIMEALLARLKAEGRAA